MLQNILLFFLSLFYLVNGFTQTGNLKVVLNQNCIVDTLMRVSVSTYINLDEKKFKGIPKHLVEYKIKSYPLQKDEDLYKLFKTGLLSQKRYAKIISYYKTDTSKLYKKDYKGSINLLYGITRNAKIMLILDENNNYNFSDDHIFIANDKQQLDSIGYLKVKNIEIFDGSVFRKINYYIKPAVRYNQEMSNDEENKWNLSIETSRVLCTEFNIENKKICFQLYGDINNGGEFNAKDDNDYSRLFVIPDSIYVNKKYKNWVGNKIKDPFNIGGASYSFEYMSKYGETVYLNKLASKISGVNVGEEVFDFTMFNPLNGRDYNYIKSNSKYMLLDFWGTWCNPCIKAIPELKQLYTMYGNNNIDFVSIAYDKKENIQGVKKMIDSLGIKWHNIMEYSNYKIKTSLVKTFKIQAYPTTILISPNGKILFRGEGLDSLEDLKAVLNETFKVHSKS